MSVRNITKFKPSNIYNIDVGNLSKKNAEKIIKLEYDKLKNLENLELEQAKKCLDYSLKNGCEIGCSNCKNCEFRIDNIKEKNELSNVNSILKQLKGGTSGTGPK